MMTVSYYSTHGYNYTLKLNFPILTGVDIGFVNATFTASESDSSVEVCVQLVSGETDITVQVELRTQPGNAQGIS